MNKKKKILIAAGGTGGHLFPAMQLAEQLTDCELLFAGHQLKSSPFFEAHRLAFAEISSHPLGLGFISACWKGFWESISLIRAFAPDLIVGLGSYHTFPLLLAGAILRKKIILFEANAILGKVNRFFAPAATKIAFQFPVPHRKGVLVPWLPWDEQKQRRIPREEALHHYRLDPNSLDPRRKTVLVFGGSQGASFLNEKVPLLLSSFREQIQVIHLTGEKGTADYASHGIPAFVAPFEKNMPRAYSAADMAICRSGAGTVAELCCFELPALLIPYPFATDDHQRKNGELLVKRGVAHLLLQKEATLERMVAEWSALFQNAEGMRERFLKEEEPRIHFAELCKKYI